MIQRDEILNPIIEKLSKADYTIAAWEGGSAAFNRVDEWSDIDLAVVVKNDKVREAFNLIEKALESVSPIELKYELPNPGWEGHSQAFYRLKDTSKFLLIDLSVIKESAPDKFLEPEVHGNCRIHIDNTGITKKASLDRDLHEKKLKKRIDNLKITFELFSALSEKEFYRGNYIEAIVFYSSFTLRPLVEALRIKHSPEHFNFYGRYIHYELPPETVKKLQELFFVCTPDDLSHKQDEASRWFYNVINSL